MPERATLSQARKECSLRNRPGRDRQYDRLADLADSPGYFHSSRDVCKAILFAGPEVDFETEHFRWPVKIPAGPTSVASWIFHSGAKTLERVFCHAHAVPATSHPHSPGPSNAGGPAPFHH